MREIHGKRRGNQGNGEHNSDERVNRNLQRILRSLRKLPVSTCASIKLGATFSLVLSLAIIALPLEQVLNFTLFPPRRVAKASLRCFVHVRRTQLAI